MYDWLCRLGLSIPNLLTRQFPVTHRRHQHLRRTVSKWCYQQYLMLPQSLPRAASFMYLWEVMQPQMQFPAAWTGWIRRGAQGLILQIVPKCSLDCEQVKGKKSTVSLLIHRLWSEAMVVTGFKGLSRKWSPSLGTWWADSEESAQDKATEAAEHQSFLGKGTDTKPCCALL